MNNPKNNFLFEPFVYPTEDFLSAFINENKSPLDMDTFNM